MTLTLIPSTMIAMDRDAQTLDTSLSLEQILRPNTRGGSGRRSWFVSLGPILK